MEEKNRGEMVQARLSSRHGEGNFDIVNSYLIQEKPEYRRGKTFEASPIIRKYREFSPRPQR